MSQTTVPTQAQHLVTTGDTTHVQIVLRVELNSLQRILAAYQTDTTKSIYLSDSFEQWLTQIVLDWVREVEQLPYEDR